MKKLKAFYFWIEGISSIVHTNMIKTKVWLIQIEVKQSHTFNYQSEPNLKE